MKDYNEGDLVTCRVTNIVRTTVFVETLEGTKGSIVVSEIAPGRIRNLRAYVVPNKIIVCKILYVKQDHLFLSLRRVKNKEKQEFMSLYKKEKTYSSIIKKLLGKEADNVIKEITSNQGMNDFMESAKKDLKVLDKYFNKEQIAQLKKVLQEKEKKKKEIKKEFILRCEEPNGITIIKKLLKNYKGIKYLGNSKYTIKQTSEDLKKLDSEISDIFNEIEKASKKHKCEFSLKK